MNLYLHFLNRNCLLKSLNIKGIRTAAIFIIINDEPLFTATIIANFELIGQTSGVGIFALTRWRVTYNCAYRFSKMVTQHATIHAKSSKYEASGMLICIVLNKYSSQLTYP